jgi:hypothetical protein
MQPCTATGMTFELPTLRLGLAGFNLEQQEQLRQVITQDQAGGLPWEFAQLTDADAFFVNGARTQVLADGTLRVAAGMPSGRSVQIAVAEMQRPIAFAQPLPLSFNSPHVFDAHRPDSVRAMLAAFEDLLRPLVAQVCLASQILEQESALGSGVCQVEAASGVQLAVIDLRGDVGLLTTASPLEFDNAMWTPVPRESAGIPDHFFRTSLSHLMWQYALRTARDVLPARYRTERLYFRRPPRLPQRLLNDAHLLLLRELAYAPATFAELQQRTGSVGAQLARDLAALYLVGAITSNPKRAALPLSRREPAGETTMGGGSLPSALGQESAAAAPRLPRPDLTVPAPMSLE